MRRAPRLDANHAEVARALRAVGCSVQSLAGVGFGVPDLLVGRNRTMYLLEVKQPGEELRASQREWAQTWRGPAPLVVRSVAEALMAVGATR